MVYDEKNLYAFNFSLLNHCIVSYLYFLSFLNLQLWREFYAMPIPFPGNKISLNKLLLALS